MEIAIAKVKQYIRNQKIQSNIAQNIIINEDYTMQESEYSTILIENKDKNQLQGKRMDR